MQNSRYKQRKKAIITSWIIFFLVGTLFGLLIGTVVVKAMTSEQETEAETTFSLEDAESEPEETAEYIASSEITTSAGDTETEAEAKLVSLGVFRLTAYCSCEKCCGYWATIRPTDSNGNKIVYTASGEKAVCGITIAADTSVLPFGTKVYINGHEYIVQDRGGAIKENRIDVYFNDHQEALNFGVQYQEVFMLQED